MYYRDFPVPSLGLLLFLNLVSKIVSLIALFSVLLDSTGVWCKARPEGSVCEADDTDPSCSRKCH